MIINEHIHHLLLERDTVAVPRLGVFHKHAQPAAFDGDMMLPPFSSVSFEVDFIADSDILEESIARATKTSRQNARSLVLEESSDIKTLISAGSEVKIGDMGSLVQGKNGDITFAANPHSLLNSWLPSLNIVETDAPSLGEIEAASEAMEEAAREVRRSVLARSARRAASSAAAIAIFALLAFVVSQLPQRPATQPQMASIGFEQTIALPEVNITPEPATPSEPTLVLLLNTPADGTAPAKVRRRPAADVATDSPARFCLIVASLASQSEADKFIQANGTTETPLHILNKDGHWRVYALSAPSAEELTAIARHTGIYDRFPSAWICRR